MAKTDSRASMVRFFSFLIIGLILTLPLAGCDGFPHAGERSLVTDNDPVSLRIAEAADKASTALQTLAKMEQGQKPVDPDSIVEGAPEELMRPVTLSWVGPIEQLLKVLADQAGYQMAAIGAKPADPIVVRVNAVNRPIIELLRSAGLQAPNQADVIVNPAIKTVELHYAPPAQR